MSLKQSSNYMAIIQAVFFTIFFVGGTGLFVVHLILAGDWSDFFSEIGLAVASVSFFFFLFLFALIFVWAAYFYGFFWRDRALNAAAQGEGRLLTPVHDQPDQALALRAGETLTLDRWRTFGHILGMSGIILLGVVVLALCGEVIVFALLPAFGHSALNPLYFSFDAPPPPAPSLLDWLTAAYPLAVSLILLAVIPYLIADQRHTLFADDEGLTIKRRLRRRRFIPWSDIALFVQTGKERSQNVIISYLLWGREHKVDFTLVRQPYVPVASVKDDKTRLEKMDTFRFAGGFGRYAADAQRLLATIAARGQVSLQHLAHLPPGVARLRRRFPSTYTPDELAEMPLASKEMQPDVSQSAVADAAIPELTLKERLSIRRILLKSVAWFIGCGVLLFACYGTTMREMLSDLSGIWFNVVVGVVLVLVAVMAVLAAGATEERFRPAITADSKGLTKKTPEKSTTVTIPWEEIRAWAIVASTPFTTRRTYLVSSERTTIVWTERADARLAGRGIQGDRRQAYQERAEQLHRLIAARTGLPLREVTASSRNTPGSA